MSSTSAIESPSGASGNGQGGTQAVDRAAALLTHVIEAEVAVTFAELSEASGLARSTTSRLLAALERNRLVERVGTGEYIGGPLFALYAARHDRTAELARLARPMLEADRRGAPARPCTSPWPTAGRVAHVAQVDSTFLLGARDWTDVDVPPHCSALGKVLLAWKVLDLPDGPLETGHRPDPAHHRATWRRTSSRPAPAASRSPSTSSRSGSPVWLRRSSDPKAPSWRAWASRVPPHDWRTGSTTSVSS